MKNEDLRFSVVIESHNDQGEKQRTAVNMSCTRLGVLRIAESLGIKLNYNSPYRMRKEKMYLIDMKYRQIIRGTYHVILGEFAHNPLLCIKRLD
jgi:hypothetical protein